MLLFSKWVELVITQDSGFFANVSALLRKAGIEYKDKIQNVGHGNRRHGEISAIGENISYSNLYQIFVKQADFENAKALMAQEKDHPRNNAV